MSIIGILLLGISLSIDALGIGISYGLRGIQLPWAAKMITTAISAAVMALSIFTGGLISSFLPENLTKLLGPVMLAALGLFIILQAMLRGRRPTKKGTGTVDDCQNGSQKEKTVFHLMIRSLGVTIQIICNPPSCDFDNSKSVDAMEALYLGFALSIDSFGVGISSAVSGMNTMAIPLAAALFQLSFLSLGRRLGGKIAFFSKLDSSIWVVCSGALLLLISILRIFCG